MLRLTKAPVTIAVRQTKTELIKMKSPTLYLRVKLDRLNLNGYVCYLTLLFARQSMIGYGNCLSGDSIPLTPTHYRRPIHLRLVIAPSIAPQSLVFAPFECLD